MRLVILESPFKGEGPNRLVRWINRWRNKWYARACMHHAIVECGDSPMASHLLYTQCLDDNNPEQRALGIKAGLAWGKAAEATVVYVDRGVTDGMKLGIARAASEGRIVQYRSLDPFKYVQRQP